MEKFGLYDLASYCDRDSLKDCELFGVMLRTVGRPKGIEADAASRDCVFAEFALLTLKLRDCFSPRRDFKPVRLFTDDARVIAVVRNEDFSKRAWRSLRGCLCFGEEGSPNLFVGAPMDGGEPKLTPCCVV